MASVDGAGQLEVVGRAVLISAHLEGPTSITAPSQLAIRQQRRAGLGEPDIRAALVPLEPASGARSRPARYWNPIAIGMLLRAKSSAARRGAAAAAAKVGELETSLREPRRHSVAIEPAFGHG